MGKLSVCMIARDEEDYIGDAISSVSDVADEVVVVDTGSRDRTRVVSAEHGAKVFDVAWNDDFSAARNESLRLATCTWILVLDADERLMPESKGELLRAISSDAELFSVNIVSLVGNGRDREVSVSLRLFRNSQRYCYQGKLHEQLRIVPPTERLPAVATSAVTLVHVGYLDSVVAKKGKQRRNYEVARVMATEHPEDAFVRFNYGVELYRLGMLQDAANEFEASSKHLNPLAAWGSKLMKTWALALLRLEDRERALEIATKGVSMYPAFTDLYYMAGVCLFEMGRYPESEARFLDCVKMGNAPVPPFAAADLGMGSYKSRYALGTAYLYEGRYGEAAQEFRMAFEEVPDWLMPLVMMGSACRAGGIVPQYQIYLRNLAKGPVFEATMLCASWIYEPVDEVLNRAGPDNSPTDVQYLRALALLGRGEFEKAQPLFKDLESQAEISRDARLAATFCGLCIGEIAMPVLADLPEADRRVLAQYFYARAILALEDGAARYPDNEQLRSELRKTRTEARRLGLRDA